MTYEEKQRLNTHLQSLPLKNIYSVDAESFWELERFVTNCKKNLSKQKRKAELALQARGTARTAPVMNSAPMVAGALNSNTGILSGNDNGGVYIFSHSSSGHPFAKNLYVSTRIDSVECQLSSHVHPLVKGLSSKEFVVCNDLVLALPNRITAISDGAAATPKQSGGWGGSGNCSPGNLFEKVPNL
ncbi:hypothetical protein KY289_001047 [Solanum tuberosum]|nr:hypothetical protein KY289_001047 [Solanum tuberosum]